jgi:putative ABC transport system substrate-binding protein
MRDNGYVEGQSFDMAERFAEGDYTRLATGAEELVSLKPGVIVALDPTAAAVVKKGTSAIPIVAPILVEPVNQGLIESYARPGGNVTGISISVKGLRAKIVELVRELVPSATAVGLLFNPTNAGNLFSRQEVEAAGKAGGMKIVSAGVTAPAEVEPAFDVLVGARVEAVIVIGDPMLIGDRAHVAGLAVAARLPTLSNLRQFAEAGCLITYGVDPAQNYRRAAHFVDKILKGAKPADLPVEFPTRIEMVINLKTAKAIGLTFPPSLLARADEVIE